jgi:tellurite resistance protein
LPKIEVLMPALSFAEVAGEADPPVAEQLVSSNALRQRRYRERLKHNGDAQQALRDANVTAASDGEEPAP